MTRPTATVSAAWFIHAVAWFVPVHKYGVCLPRGVPGWEAFRIALSPLWPYEGSGWSGPWYGNVVISASALTNVIMLASLVIALQKVDELQRVAGWAAIGACVLNSYWWVADKDRVDLRIGYYLWWLSFLVLGLGLLTTVRKRQRLLDVASGRTRG
jgi:hypothetical protein